MLQNNVSKETLNRRKITISGHDILICKADSSLKIIIKPLQNNIENRTLSIYGKNLYDGTYDNGYLLYGKEKLRANFLKKCKTSKWFPVLSKQGKSLVLSGTAHNRSTWQFKTADNKIITEVGKPQKYKIPTDVVQDKTISKVDIPPEALYARVFFYCKDGKSYEMDDRLQIEYGKIPTHYETYKEKHIQLPDLSRDEYLVYENGTWVLVKDKLNQNTPLDLGEIEFEAGKRISVDGTNYQLEVSWEEGERETIRSGIYGVRWSLKDSNPICERVGDAKGLRFNYMIEDQFASPYENDFDYIYPWSDMKICAVRFKKNGKRKVIYQGEEGFQLDGSVGNIMVEIPRFYTKREIIDDYEYLWISPTKQEGFKIDPAFVTEEKKLKRIYIGAYLSNIRKKQLRSMSNSFPLIKRSLVKLRELAENSNGFAVCDLLTILAVQKLFIVETAILDSQSIFTGNVLLPYLLRDKSTSYYAIRSEMETNHIFVVNSVMTRRFRVGDAVSILNSWKEYKNKPGKYQREILEINPVDDKTFEIVFSGEPVDIIERETGITCIPCKNGETDHIPYMTGCIAGHSGHASFKYRGIENLWGNVSILLDKAYVKNSTLYIEYPNGKTKKINYPLPEQKVQLSLKQFGDPHNMIVKRMGYDKKNSLIMFPCEIGNGATTSSYYCDSWYNLAEKDVTYILTYGGAWDNKGYAGIFNFRATFTERKTIPYNGARIILR